MTSGNGASTLVLIHEMGGTLESWDLSRPARREAPSCATTRAAPDCRRRSAALTIDTMATISCPMDALGIAAKSRSPVAVGGAIACIPRRFRSACAASPAARPSVAPIAARLLTGRENGARACSRSTRSTGYPPELRGDAQRFAPFAPAGSAAIRQLGAIYRMLSARICSPSCAHRLSGPGDAGASIARPPHWSSRGAHSRCAYACSRRDTTRRADARALRPTIGEFLDAVGA